MPETDLELLISAARHSGEIAQKFFNSSPEVWDKAGGQGPVTEADLAVNTMLKTELLNARPDYGWLSEESEDDEGRLRHERVFIVDPIDGTRAFIAGEKTWSHSIAIAENGKVTAAAVYVPMLDRLFTATSTQAAQMNSEDISPTTCCEDKGATVLCAKPNLKPEFWKGGNVPPVARKFRPSLAYRLCLVAKGRYDAMITLRDCWEWDIAAGALIVEKAGGRVTDRLDNTLKFNSSHPMTKGCHAANPVLHGILQSQLSND